MHRSKAICPVYITLSNCSMEQVDSLLQSTLGHRFKPSTASEHELTQWLVLVLSDGDYPQAIERLFALGLSLDHRCENHLLPPLDYAAWFNRPRSIEVLINHKADVTIRHQYPPYRSLLCVALQGQVLKGTQTHPDSIRTVEILLAQPKVANLVCIEKLSPLQHAIYHGSVLHVETVLDKGAYIDEIDEFGRTTIEHAFQNVIDFDDIVRTLMRRGAGPEQSLCNLSKRIKWCEGMIADTSVQWCIQLVTTTKPEWSVKDHHRMPMQICIAVEALAFARHVSVDSALSLLPNELLFCVFALL